MNSYIIATDSNVDLPNSLANELELAVIPMQFSMDGKDYTNYLDHREMSAKAFYDGLREGKTATTMLINQTAFLAFFEPILQTGSDILYLCFSSGLSGSCEQAELAAQTLCSQYPERTIKVIDTRCASMGEGLLVYLAANAKEQGQTLEQAAKTVEGLIPQLCQWFTVDDLGHLKRGGRISGATAMLGTMLGIKPILHVDDHGKLVQRFKARGRAKALEALLNQMRETVIDPKNQTVFISHGDAREDAEQLADMIKQRLGVKDIRIGVIGPVIGAHAGPGTIALFFVGKHR